MADEDINKTDLSEDEDDTEGHRYTSLSEDEDDTEGHRFTSASPDPEREANRQIAVHPAVSGDDDDDVEGHRLHS